MFSKSTGSVTNASWKLVITYFHTHSLKEYFTVIYEILTNFTEIYQL